jgi:magnesium-transporting ATPase (P-type)
MKRLDSTDSLSGVPEGNVLHIKDEAEDCRIVRLNQAQDVLFCDNRISTSQYTPIDFLPKFLLHSFMKLANFYFLMVSAMQCIPEISNTNGMPTTAPVLAFILFIDAIFQVLEDLERHRADAEANNRRAHILSTEQRSFGDERWVDVAVGSVVKILNKEPVPADVLLLACATSASNPDGICNVETKELDGETNLKLRVPLQGTADLIRAGSELDDLCALQAEIKCELPNRFISRFSATCAIRSTDDAEVVPVDISNVLLRGSVLHSVDHVFALVLNTGVETKIMQNMRKSELKQSTIDKQINTLILYIISFLFVLCLCGAVGSSSWNHANIQRAWYFRAGLEPSFFNNNGLGWELQETVVTFFYFFLITSQVRAPLYYQHCTTSTTTSCALTILSPTPPLYPLSQFVSVSLYVSMTSVKFVQAIFMRLDLSMYHEETDTPMKVRTMAYAMHSYTHTLCTALAIGTHYGPHTPCTHTLHSL